MNTQPRYWIGEVPETDDFGVPITDTFYDAKTRHGPWAFMAPSSWHLEGSSATLGTGYGQKYEKQADGKWMKVAG